MQFSALLGRQLAEPRGVTGRLLGMAMDFANRAPSDLGLALLSPSPGMRVLDAGCGAGAVLRRLVNDYRCHAVGIDRSPAMIAAATRRLRRGVKAGKASIMLGSIGALPFDAQDFDGALALNVLYFADWEGSMVADLRRVLRPGGALVAYVTHRETMRGWAFTRHGTHRLFDRSELLRALADGGFAEADIAIHALNIARNVKGLLAIARA